MGKHLEQALAFCVRPPVPVDKYKISKYNSWLAGSAWVAFFNLLEYS